MNLPVSLGPTRHPSLAADGRDRRDGSPRCSARPASSLSWPSLDQLQLEPAQLLWRREGIGGSDANIILCGDHKKILRLWREKRAELEPEYLSGHLPVMLAAGPSRSTACGSRWSWVRASQALKKRWSLPSTRGADARSTDALRSPAQSGRRSTATPLPRLMTSSSVTCPSATHGGGWCRSGNALDHHWQPQI